MPTKPSRVLVVPSNRVSTLPEFLEAWQGKGGWDHAVLVEDAPAKTWAPAYQGAPGFDAHVSHTEVAADLGQDAWVISKRDSACLCYGFLLAWRLGAEHVLTLSDDCFPTPDSGNLFAEHHAAMAGHRRWVPSVPGVRTRGLPYRDLGWMPPAVINVGLWTGNADYDAVQSLSRFGQDDEDFRPPPGSHIVPRGQHVPMCEMNLCVTRKAFPLMYFPLMGEGSPYRRMDDIWAGVIAKHVCDHLGWSVSVGEPFVRHARASDPLVNLAKEAPGIVANETFWQVVDRIRLSGGDALTCMGEVGRALADLSDAYLSRLGQAILIWVKLFEAAA